VASFAELVREHLALKPEPTAHLQRLIRSWGLLADLSFSDVLLFAPTSADRDKLILLGHVRPTTAQTIYRTDLVGELFRSTERPIVNHALVSGEISDDSLRLIGLDEVRIRAIPVRHRGDTVAVLTRESLPVLGRSTSDLERTYLELFERFARMIAAGEYPFARDQDDQYRIPRVGDGIVVLDASMRVEFNSPNAVSALHRLGVHVNAEGFTPGELGLDDRIIHEAYATRASTFEELERGPDTTVIVNCIPLLEHTAVTGALLVVRDISELRRRDRLLMSKDATIREIHHRVKNNLQTISSLLRLQSRRLASEEAKAAVEESVRRIASIAVVHETLAQDVGDEVALLDIVRPLVRMVQEGLVSPDRPIHFTITGDAGVLPAQVTTPLAVAVTELLQNVVEHAYPAGYGVDREGRVVIQLSRQADVVTIRVLDDGVGVPDGFELAAAGGLGLTIVRTFVELDLGGTIVMRAREDGPGTFVELVVPVDAAV
jgi:two-component sensor histidine kinase